MLFLSTKNQANVIESFKVETIAMNRDCVYNQTTRHADIQTVA